MNTFKIQYDCDGNFRIVMLGAEESIIAMGAWMFYTGIATLEYGGCTYIAGSSYGMLQPEETVFYITTKPTELDNSMEDTYRGRVR
jgi:hypothetical protein